MLVILDPVAKGADTVIAYPVDKATITISISTKCFKKWRIYLIYL